jgi:phosphoribosylpyrophosphate synthetase
MLLNEIVTDIERDEENDINTHRFNSAASEKLAAGSRQIRIDMTPDDEELFAARTEMLKSSANNLPQAQRTELLRSIRVQPPSHVTAIYAYTLQKKPGNVQDTLKTMGIMSAVKNRNAKEVMPEEEIQAYLDASVARILKFTKGYRQSLSKYGKGTTRENEEGERLHQIYRKFLGPYLDGKFSQNSVIVPLGSTSGLVGKFAKSLGDAIHSDVDMLTGAFMKNHFPKFDMYNKGTKDSPHVKELRIPVSYTTALEKDPAMVADPAVQSWIKKLTAARTQSATAAKAKDTTAEEKKELQDHVNLCLKNLRQSLTHYITTSQAAVSATLKEITACRRRYTSFTACIKTAEYKELRRKFKDEVAVLKAIPLPTYDVANFKSIEKDLHIVTTYLAAQDHVADDIDQIVQNVNAISAGQATLESLRLQAQIDSKRAAFVASVTKLINQAVNDPFKVHNYYANLEVNNGKAFSAYMVLHDELYDKLEGKNIILVDDNIGTGATVRDAVKAIFYAGISPLNIVVMAPHYLDDGGGDEVADKKAVAAAKRAYNAREAENTTVLHQDITPGDVTKQFGNISQMNKLKNIAKTGAERLKRKLSQ